MSFHQIVGALAGASGGGGGGGPTSALPDLTATSGNKVSLQPDTVVNVVPTAVNLGDILQPLVAGSRENGGSGVIPPSPYRIERGIKTRVERSETKKNRMGLVLAGIAAAGVVVFGVLMRRR